MKTKLCLIVAKICVPRLSCSKIKDIKLTLGMCSLSLYLKCLLQSPGIPKICLKCASVLHWILKFEKKLDIKYKMQFFRLNRGIFFLYIPNINNKVADTLSCEKHKAHLQTCNRREFYRLLYWILYASLAFPAVLSAYVLF